MDKCAVRMQIKRRLYHREFEIKKSGISKSKKLNKSSTKILKTRQLVGIAHTHMYRNARTQMHLCSGVPLPAYTNICLRCGIFANIHWKKAKKLKAKINKKTPALLIIVLALHTHTHTYTCARTHIERLALAFMHVDTH